PRRIAQTLTCFGGFAVAGLAHPFGDIVDTKTAETAYPSAVARRPAAARHHQPGEPGADQRDRNRVADHLVAEVADEFAAAAVAGVVDELVDHLPGRHASAQLIERRCDLRAGRLGFAFKLLAGSHRPPSLGASPPKRPPGVD